MRRPFIATSATGEEREGRRYLLISLVPILCLAGVMLAAGLWLGPNEGDLTRIGGYSERLFGWQEPDEALPPGLQEVRRLSFAVAFRATSPSDIVVFGDSFSAERGGRLSWVDVLQHQTGLSVRVVRSSGYHDVAEYLNSPLFRDRPPRAVIVETVERAQMINAWEAYDPAAGCNRIPSPAKIAGHPATGRIETRPAMRRTQFASLDELYSRVAVAVRSRLSRTARVITVDLTRRDLFSSAMPERLLFFPEDISRHMRKALGGRSQETAARQAICGLRRLARLAGDVPLWLVTAPDKRTIYAPWIADTLPGKAIDVFPIAQEALGRAFIDLRASLQNAVERGVRDVYLPNDTHWGARGHRLVGDAVAKALVATDD